MVLYIVILGFVYNTNVCEYVVLLLGMCNSLINLNIIQIMFKQTKINLILPKNFLYLPIVF